MRATGLLPLRALTTAAHQLTWAREDTRPGRHHRITATDPPRTRTHPVKRSVRSTRGSPHRHVSGKCRMQPAAKKLITRS